MAELPEHLRAAPARPARVSRRVLAEHQRERVLALVTPVFAKRGYPGTTVDDLLASGKVGVGNFYELFEGKEDCFFAACERAISNARAAIEAATEAGSGWNERSYLGLAAALSFMLAEPMQARLVLLEAQSAGPVATARYNAVMDEAIAWLRQGRKANRAARALPQSFEQAAITGLAYYLQQCLIDSRRHTTGELLEETAALLLQPILGAEELRRLARVASASAPI